MAKAQTPAQKRAAQRRTVVANRDKKAMSWAEIAEQLEVAPRTVRRLYDEVKGEDAHYASRLEGKGGRTQVAA